MSHTGITTFMKTSKFRTSAPPYSANKPREHSKSSLETSKKTLIASESHHTIATPQAVGHPPKTRHSSEEIWKWTLTHDAIAPCFVKDIFGMQECEYKDGEFYWLGRVPCRTVRIVGMLVGVQTYEKRTIYSVDDGSGVIDCAYRHPIQPPLCPKKRPSTEGKESMLQKYQRPTKPPLSTSKPAPSAPPPPLARIGAAVHVVGRITKKHETRQINVDELRKCTSSNDEPSHWLTVCELHRTSYFASDGGLFVIPPPSTSETTLPWTASLTGGTTTGEPQTPSKSSVASSSAHTTPSSVCSDIPNPKSPPRLRHPSRLHTRDLNANTFRIYLKHYMDNAPPEEDDSNATSESGTEDEEDRAIGFSLRNTPDTPTKRKTSPYIQSARLLPSHGGSEMTPRPSKQLKLMSSVDATPRASSSTTQRHRRSSDHDLAMQGFQLSHLRRVPELVLLARRVVEAEAKRRGREEKKRLQSTDGNEAARKKGKLPAHNPYSGSSKPTVPGSLSASGKEGEGIGPKMKRLFRFAIRQLHDEGSIVIWYGACRRIRGDYRAIPRLSFESGGSIEAKSSCLWKLSSTSTSIDSTRNSLNTCLTQDNDEGELSDPPSDEEAYVSLTPVFLLDVVEHTIREAVSRPRSLSRHGKVGPISRLPGPTPEEILKVLQSSDGRWDRVGVWAIKDSLEAGRAAGRVWCVGGDRWEVCE